FADPHFAERGTIEEIMHPVLGALKVPAVLPRLSETPGAIRCLGPELGNWNDRIEALLADDAEVRPKPCHTG
ncbi:MAG: CoA transferase, partial [Pseudomonadota bacterium]